MQVIWSRHLFVISCKTIKMKKIYSFIILACLAINMMAQDTFSIVAVDVETGEVGSAGATCLDIVEEGASADIISDILPGKGAINTQSFYIPANQNNARTRMEAGDSPAEIMIWLQANDIQNDASQRQYGAVDIANGMARSAAFTGDNCFNYKGDLTGIDYAIQGNILIGSEVLEGMEDGFLNTTGSLADRLMAAMQGANIPGADSRCLGEGVSSRSAFLQVAKPDDAANDLYLDIRVQSTPLGEEPIDSLQNAYDIWKTTVATTELIEQDFQVKTYPNPSNNAVNFSIADFDRLAIAEIVFYNTNGQLLHQKVLKNADFVVAKTNLGDGGLVFYHLKNTEGMLLAHGKIMLFNK